MYKKDFCSPLSKGKISCLDDDLITYVAKALNKIKHKNLQKINCNQTTKHVYHQVCDSISKISSCSSEPCWLDIRELMKHLGDKKQQFKELFRPQMPKEWLEDYNTWLTTVDINNVLEQYNKRYSDFYYGGAVPIDFDLQEDNKCVVSELCNFNLQSMLNKKMNNMGIIFNTHPHYKGGEHWISLFVNISGDHLDKHPGIYYFDSFGRKPPPQIKELINSLINQGKENNIDFTYLYNNKIKQKGNSQCGMYSIDFILHKLDNNSFHDYMENKAIDTRVDKLRSVYFIDPRVIKN